mmetsp:Transcript_20040/g.55851  ORF Transcript_20040/g.55851 Transcript_20040/m.55851 type:complete len:223 (+) Transcript_20040:88-756(+)
MDGTARDAALTQDGCRAAEHGEPRSATILDAATQGLQPRALRQPDAEAARRRELDLGEQDLGAAEDAEGGADVRAILALGRGCGVVDTYAGELQLRVRADHVENVLATALDGGPGLAHDPQMIPGPRHTQRLLQHHHGVPSQVERPPAGNGLPASLPKVALHSAQPGRGRPTQRQRCRWRRRAEGGGDGKRGRQKAVTLRSEYNECRCRRQHWQGGGGGGRG